MLLCVCVMVQDGAQISNCHYDILSFSGNIKMMDVRFVRVCFLVLLIE